MTATKWTLLIAAVILATLLSLAIGAVRLDPAAVLHALTGAGDPTTVTIVRDVRLPRVILALSAGAALAMSGATLQGVLRNPLAEPYLLGVSGGAAVGAVMLAATGLNSGEAIAGAAFIGAALAVGVVLALSRVAGGRFDPRVLLMSGVVVGAFANAAIMIVLANQSPNAVRGALWWMMGSLGDAGWRDVRWLFPLVAIGAGALIAKARDIDALSLGEDAAAGVGVDPERAGRALFFLSSLVAAATVAAAGLIGFVGLVVPALARAMGARRARTMLIASGLAGAALLTIADLAARTLRAPAELPVGAVTALVGVPFFLIRLGRIR